jgi:hypothetical protein
MISYTESDEEWGQVTAPMSADLPEEETDDATA